MTSKCHDLEFYFQPSCSNQVSTTISELVRQFITNIYMLTGDSKSYKKNIDLGAGCRKNIISPEFLGVDRFRFSNIGAFKVWDLRSIPLPFMSDSAKYIYCSHVIEHLGYADGRKLLSECYRILEVDGVLRLVFPDLDKYLAIAASDGGKYFPCSAITIWKLCCTSGHVSVWNSSLMLQILEAIGFQEMSIVMVKQSRYGFPVYREDACKSYESCYIEARKG